MKPIYLAPDDEITSVVEKISKISDQKLALVAPKNSSIFQSLINLKLLKKEAARLDKEIILITGSKVGQKLADQVGIKYFANVSAVGITETFSEPVAQASEVLPDGTKIHQYNPAFPAQTEKTEDEEETPESDDEEEAEVDHEEVIDDEEDEDEPEIPPVKPEEEPKIETAIPVHTISQDDLPAISGGGFSTHTEFSLPWRSIVGALAILFIAFIALFLFLPKAYITASFPSKKVDTKLAVSVLTEGIVGENDLEGVKLSESKSATQTVKATGKKDIGTKATGTISITNKFKDGSGVGKDQTFSAGTKVTDTKTNKVFTLNSATTIGRVTYDPNNGQPIYQTKSAGVTAIEPGESYNIAASTFNITGALSGVTATSSATFTGGLTKQVTVLSQDDLTNGFKELKSKTNAELLTQIKTKAEAKQVVESAITYKVTKESANKSVGDQVSEAILSYDVNATVIVFDLEALKTKIKTVLSKDIKENEELIISDKTFEQIKSTPEAKSLKLDLQAQGDITVKIDKDKMVKEVKNKSPEQINSILKEKYSATEVKVDISPSWWLKRSPLFSWAIKIEPVFK